MAYFSLYMFIVPMVASRDTLYSLCDRVIRKVTPGVHPNILGFLYLYIYYLVKAIKILFAFLSHHIGFYCEYIVMIAEIYCEILMAMMLWFDRFHLMFLFFVRILYVLRHICL